MSRASSQLEIVEFWRAMPLKKPPFIHPQDLPVLLQQAPESLKIPPADFSQFIASKRFGHTEDHRFHFSLLPVPYHGDLNRADIFLLQLNPGVNLDNYYAEWNVPAFRRMIERCVRQELDGVQFPFHSLDPELCWHSTFRWWEGKLRDVASIIARRKYKGRYLDALRELSRRIAVIELVPYHSSAFKAHRLLRVLPSSAQAKDVVHSILLKRASSGQVRVVVMRKVAAWGLAGEARRGLIQYPTSQSRSSSLGARSPGGKAILERFGIEA